MNRLTRRFSDSDLHDGAAAASKQTAARPGERNSVADGNPPSLQPPVDSAFGLAEVWEQARRAAVSERSPAPPVAATPASQARKVQFFLD